MTTPTSEKPPLDLVFLDVETTGLDSQKHEILEVAAIRVTADLSRILDKFCTEVRPTRLHDADPTAIEVNGYSDAEWADAIELDEALTVRWRVRWRALDATCDALGIPQERKHRALDDVRAALQVARVVRERWLLPPITMPATPHPRIVELRGPGLPRPLATSGDDA